MENAILCLILVSSCPFIVEMGEPNPCDCPCTCCDGNELKLDLSTGDVTGDLAACGASYYVSMSTTGSNCNNQVVLNVTFDEPKENEEKCQAECGRRMLKVDMVLNDVRGGWLFNFGNSPTNDGWKGDNVDNSYDAELHGLNERISAYGNDNCTTTKTLYEDAVDSNITVRISSGFYHIENTTGVVDSVCDDECFFELSRQFDIEKNAINDLDFYLGFNRVIKPTSPRIGKGVCSATLSWECCWTPPEESDPKENAE